MCGQEHAADRKESKRRWALHDAVQAFKKAVRTRHRLRVSKHSLTSRELSSAGRGGSESQSGASPREKLDALGNSIVGRLGEEAQQAESNSIKLAEVVTAMRKAHLKEACADGFALRRTKRGAEAEAAEAAEAAGKLRRCKEDGAAAAEVRRTGSPMPSRRGAPA